VAQGIPEDSYLVKWEGFASKHNSWVAEKDILDKTLIKTFKAGLVPKGR
jgi:hypothetical protein